jgi:hypothetical protein
MLLCILALSACLWAADRDSAKSFDLRRLTNPDTFRIYFYSRHWDSAQDSVWKRLESDIKLKTFEPFNLSHLNNGDTFYGHLSPYHWVPKCRGWQILASNINFKKIVWDQKHIEISVRKDSTNPWITINDKNKYEDGRVIVYDPKKVYADYHYKFTVLP